MDFFKYWNLVRKGKRFLLGSATIAGFLLHEAKDNFKLHEEYKTRKKGM